MTSRALLAVVTLFLAACTVAPKPGGNGSAMVAPDSMESVVKRTFTTYGFRLQSGKTLPEVTIAYETYGTAGAGGRNAVLLTHGYTWGQHMAGRSGANGAEGSWDGLVGPGKAIDTERLFVVSSNMLGSSSARPTPPSPIPPPASPTARTSPTSPWSTSSTPRRRCSTGSA